MSTWPLACVLPLSFSLIIILMFQSISYAKYLFYMLGTYNHLGVIFIFINPSKLCLGLAYARPTYLLKVLYQRFLFSIGHPTYHLS